MGRGGTPQYTASTMQSVWMRANAVLVFGLVVLGFCAGCAAVSSYWLALAPPNPSVDLRTLYHLQRSRRYPVGGERANFTFVMDVDFEPVFNWNVRQVFVYVTAEYDTEDHEQKTNHNAVTVWDRVIRPDGREYPYWQHCTRKECDGEPCREDDMQNCQHMMEWAHVWVPEDLNGKPSPNGKRPIGWLPGKEYGCKYLLKHPSEELRYRDITLTFNYDIMPLTGGINIFPGLTSKSFRLPQTYTRQRKEIQTL
jgi:hypothetical protein